MSQTKAQLVNPAGVFTLTDQLVGVGATFSGNVSIAGTLTKQDVTNVDSVGVITARSDIIIGGNIAHLGDTDTKIAFTNNQIDFHANNSSRLYVNQYATYLQTAYPLAFLSSSGASPSIKSGGTNNQDLLLTTGTDNPTRLHIQSDGKIGIGTNSASALLHIEGTQTGLQIERNTQTLKIDANYGNGGDQSLEASAALRIYTNGANERIRIASNGNVKIGSGSPNLAVGSGLEIDTGGAVTIRLEDSGAGSGFEIQNTGGVIKQRLYNGQSWVIEHGSGEKFRVASSGQIGIAGANYGNAGQVLTSGGSGSIVSWADAAGGAEFTGISSGSISAGNPVIVHPDGKLSKVGYSWAADLYPNPSGNSNVVQPSGSTMMDYAVAMWARQSDGTFAAGANPMVSFFYKNNSGQPQYRTSEVTNGTTNMVHKYSSGFNQGDGVGEFDIAWNPDVSNAASGGRMAAVFNRTSGGNSYPNVQILRGPYSNGVWTQGSNTVLDSTAAQGGISIAWHDTNRWVTVYGQSGSYYGHVVTLTGSTSASVGAKSSAIETGLANMSYRGHMSDKDNNGKHIVFYAAKTTGNRNSWRYSVATLSGTTVSFGTPNWIGNDANPGLAIGDFIPATSFDPDQNRFLVVYYKQTSTNGGSAVNKIYGRNAIISGTSVTWSAETEISNNNSSQGYDTTFDTNLKKHFVYIQDGTGANVIYNLVNFTGSAAPSTTSNAYVYSGSFEFKNLGIDYDSTYGMIVTGGRDGTDGNHLKEFITRTALSSSNLGDNNFVGFSKGSYTDGNTAKIGSLSALDENQTGLTTATTYYVKDDGTLSTTPSTPMVAAGKAVSSTNLIVKDATARPGSLGHWTYSLTGGAAFKPWCATGYSSNSGGIIGAYECANGSCRYCTGCWQPYCCNQSASEVWNYDLPTVGGGNMCLGCGGCSCDSAYNFTRACCCCWPTGRFWFPEVGIYCYNFNIILGACMGAPPSGGCWSTVSYYTVPKDRNRTCCNVFCGINGYQAYSASICGYCEPRYAFENIHMDGIVGVADTTKNFMAFGIHKASMTNCVIVQNGLQLRYDGCIGRYPNTVSFQKISNDPRITYCN